MQFRNLTICRLPTGWTRTPGEIESTLTEFPLHPCTGLAELLADLRVAVGSAQ